MLGALAATAALATDSEPAVRQTIREKDVIGTTLGLAGDPIPRTFSASEVDRIVAFLCCGDDHYNGGSDGGTDGGRERRRLGRWQ